MFITSIVVLTYLLVGANLCQAILTACYLNSILSICLATMVSIGLLVVPFVSRQPIASLVWLAIPFAWVIPALYTVAYHSAPPDAMRWDEFDIPRLVICMTIAILLSLTSMKTTYK